MLKIRVPIGNSRAQLTEMRDALVRSVGRITSADDDEDFENTPSELERQLAGVMSPGRRAKPESDVDASTDVGFTPLQLPLSSLDNDARSPAVKWIHVNDSLFDFNGAKFRIYATTETENVYENPAVVKFFKPVTDCKEVRFIIHIAEQADSVQKLSVEFATGARNELRIGPQTTPKAVEFIIRRVWERASDELLPPSPVDDFGRATDEGPVLSPPDLESLSQRYPYLVNAFKGLNEWIKAHPTAEYVDLDRLRKEATAGVPSEDFAVALAALVEESQFARKYRLRPSQGRRFLTQTFDTLDEILSGDLKDPNGDAINLEDAKVVAVFGKAER